MQIKLDVPHGITADRLRLFCDLQEMETWFRELVYVEMKCRFGTSWWDECAMALKRSRRKGMSPDRSLRNDRKHSHMATRENDPLWFLSFDLLLVILFDGKLWKLFHPYLTTKALVRAKFTELMPVRHRIAHARALHDGDLSRVRQVLRDFDQGFWSFCTSYNASRGFTPERKNDPLHRFVAQHYLNQHGRVRADLQYVVRASQRRGLPKTTVRRPGVFYDLQFRTRGQECFNVPEAVQDSSGLHDRLLHMFFSFDQRMVRITLPAMLDEARLIETADAFYKVLSSHTTPFPRLPVATVASGKTADAEYEKVAATHLAFASGWPHYIVSGGNPLSFLDPDNPCQFFLDA